MHSVPVVNLLLRLTYTKTVFKYEYIVLHVPYSSRLHIKHLTLALYLFSNETISLTCIYGPSIHPSIHLPYNNRGLYYGFVLYFGIGKRELFPSDQAIEALPSQQQKPWKVTMLVIRLEARYIVSFYSQLSWGPCSEIHVCLSTGRFGRVLFTVFIVVRVCFGVKIQEKILFLSFHWTSKRDQIKS